MLLVSILSFFLFRSSLGSVIESTPGNLLKEQEKYSVCFFSNRFDLNVAQKLEPVQVHGRFLLNSAQDYDTSLLQECADLNLSGASSKKKSKFVKRLKEIFGKNGGDKSKLAAALGNHHCIHAVSSCDADFLGQGLLVKLFTEFPAVSKKFSNLFAELEDYSFLTVELVEILFAERNVVVRPFALRSLVETVSLEVIVRLLEMWNFDLRTEDVQLVLSVWAHKEEFLRAIEADPRSWLLWRKANIYKPFPFDLLLQELSVQTIEKYGNLILAFILESESFITKSLCHLEFLHADFHKNDSIEEKYMTPEMISALDSRKWDLWHAAGKPYFDTIALQMSLKKRLINKLLELKEQLKSTAILDGSFNEHMSIYELLTLLQVPMNYLARTTFNRSRNVDEVIAAMENVDYYFPFYVPVVRQETLLNQNFWTVLWKQIEVLEIELAYDAKKSLDLAASRSIVETLVVRFRNKTTLKRSYWYTQFLVMLINPVEDNEFIATSLLEFHKNDICELGANQINTFRRFVRPEIWEKDLKFIEVADYTLDAFKFAPHLLSAEEVEYLLNDPVLKELMKSKAENVTKLRSMSAFTVENLMEFFPIGYKYHLEQCEGLYTLKPEVLVAYLADCEGAVNFPEKLVWQAHPDCWNDARFVDLISEIIPFIVFLKHPRDSDSHNFTYIITDIVGRLNRRNPQDSPQKLIIKWIVHMEWLFLQFFNNSCSGSDLNGPVYRQYKNLLLAEKRARADLITWLKSNNTLEDRDILLELVSKVPTSYIRAAYLYDTAVLEILLKYKDLSIPTFEIYNETELYKVKISDLEAAARDSIVKCEEMIKKHLGFVEGQLWMNRLEFVNIPQVNKFLLNPVSRKFFERLFINNTAPHDDLQSAGFMLLRSGYLLNVPTNEKSKEFLTANEAILKKCERMVEAGEETFRKGRALLIEAEMSKRKSSKKPEK